jgi:hypothetical protein
MTVRDLRACPLHQVLGRLRPGHFISGMVRDQWGLGVPWVCGLRLFGPPAGHDAPFPVPSPSHPNQISSVDGFKAIVQVDQVLSHVRRGANDSRIRVRNVADADVQASVYVRVLARVLPLVWGRCCGAAAE